MILPWQISPFPLKRLSCWIFLSVLIGAAGGGSAETLEEGFARPPVTARPLVWWHWVNGNVTKEGIAADLEDMKRVGIGGVQMFDVEIYLPPGPVRYGTENWHEHVQFAMKKAAELGLEFHVVNGPGWSASGGPWVTPARSMKRVVWSETPVEGGPISVSLPKPETKPYYAGRGVPKEEFYRDIAVLAVPRAGERIEDLDKKIGWSAKPVGRSEKTGAAAARADQVIDLTGRVDSEGRLTATLPAGEWDILRFGFTTTGKTNHPAVPEGHGLEIDKLDAEAVAFQFERSVGRLIKDSGPLAGRTFNGLLFDSFEGGFQNWTDRFPELFEERKGYSIIPWLPLLAGRIVESAAASEAVLWDFRDVIDGLFAESYFGTMRRLAAGHGLKVYSETQGGPLNPMSANRHVDVPMNEFWTPDASNRAARIKQSTSAAAFLGRPLVAAEAFTSTPEHGKYRNTPAALKRPGDLAFTLGLNRFDLHSYVHQPVTDAAPGFSLGRYGVHFGRLNTWWAYAGAWIEYLSRAQFLLQQGRTVADVCFLVDEDLGYGFPAKAAESVPGYDFQVAYPPYLEKMTVRDGKLVHPDAGEFRLLVVPDRTVAKTWVASVATLQRLRDLAKAGAVLAGDPPTAPAGLADLRMKAEFDSLVEEIWGGLDGRKNRSKPLGAGEVYLGMKPLEILEAEDVAPDLAWRPENGAFPFIHKTSPGAEVYFVFNNSDKPLEADLWFRQKDRLPEIWDARTGSHAPAPIYRAAERGMTVPVAFEPWGSAFVVFRKPLPAVWMTDANPVNLEAKDGRILSDAPSVEVAFSDGRKETLSLPPRPATQVIAGPWRVAFSSGRGAPPETSFAQLVSWTDFEDPGIKYYSGTGVYESAFESPAPAEGQVAMLDLGDVADIAEVSVNGRSAGILWNPPFRTDITKLLKAGSNTLEIRVANRWINRLIGDEAVEPDGCTYQAAGKSKFTDGRLEKNPDWLYEPAKRAGRKRQSFSSWKHYEADSPLVKSGLLGPVRIEWFNEVTIPGKSKGS